MAHNPIVVIGQGGHRRVIASLLGRPPLMMSDSEFFARPPDAGNVEVIVGIGDNDLREEIFHRAVAAGFRMGICVAKSAFVAPDAAIGAGSVIGAGAVIGARAVIGRNAIVNTLSSVDHDCVLGDHSQVTAGVTIAGSVVIGQRCFLGMKSGVIDKITIGDKVMVMAGALVCRDTPDNVTVGGVPARIQRRGS